MTTTRDHKLRQSWRPLAETTCHNGGHDTVQENSRASPASNIGSSSLSLHDLDMILIPDPLQRSPGEVRDLNRQRHYQGSCLEATLVPGELNVIKKSEGSKNINKRSSLQGKGKLTEKVETRYIPPTHCIIGLLVTCCFNLPLGVLAMYCSIKAAGAYRDGQSAKGAWRARASIIISLVGIMATMLAVSSVVVYVAVNKHKNRKFIQRTGSSSFGF